MEGGKLWKGIKQAYIRYDQMMEKQGFYVVLAVCVIVIVLSAVYTFRLRDDGDGLAGTTAEESRSVGGSQESQTLAEAQALIVSQGSGQPVSVPTQAPFTLAQPVAGFTQRSFSDSEPQFFAQSNCWQAHTGIDLEAEYGTPVAACAKGKVKAVIEDNQLGLCVVIDHENGYETLYAGLSGADYVQAGDPVSQGQTIGHVGNGVMFESDASPHLHFEVHREGKPVDPLAAFLGLDN